MFTILLALAHSRSTNPNFKPELMYIGTFIIDVNLISALAAMAM